MEPDDSEATASPSPEWTEPQSANFIQIVGADGEPLPPQQLTVYIPPCEKCAELRQIIIGYESHGPDGHNVTNLQYQELRRDRDALKAKLEIAEARPCVEICQEERAKGNGGCGACALCCKEWREKAEQTYPELAEANAVYAQKIMSLETELALFREYHQTTFLGLYQERQIQLQADFAHTTLRQQHRKIEKRFEDLVTKLEALDARKKTS